MESIQKLRSYADQLEQAERELSRLEESAAQLRGKVEDSRAQRDAVEANIEAVEGKIAGLFKESKDLKSELFDAWAYSKTSEQQRLKKRMHQVQDELEKCQKERDGLLASLDNLDDGYDLDAAVAIAVERDRVSVPSAYDAAEELRKALVRDVSALESLKPSVPGTGTAEFEAARRRVDEAYDARNRHEEWQLDRLASKVAANDALTQAMRENKGDNREIDARTGYVKGGARDRAYQAKTATI